MPLQATSGAASYDAFGGGVPVVPTYIEDVFSTWLYDGSNSATTITNGIDLSTKGGLVWTKCRSSSQGNHLLIDTVRGVNKPLRSNEAAAQYTETTVTAFNANGYNIAGGNGDISLAGRTYVGWTFRKQPKFFDVVTYTGDGTANRQISHALGSTPGCVIVKNTTDAGTGWIVWHRSINGVSNLFLNTTDSVNTLGFEFLVGTDATVFTITTAVQALNQSGKSYVAYLFAHNAGGFGLTGTDNVISCGTFTPSGGVATVNLGYEPQFVMMKNSTSANDWFMFDTMRGFSETGDVSLFANTSGQDTPWSPAYWKPTSTGFTTNTVWNDIPTIYIAIRRGPMKVPTDATKVFAPVKRTGSGTTATVTSTVTPTDLMFSTNTDRVASSINGFWDRLRGASLYLNSNTTNAEVSNPSINGFDVQNGVRMTGNLPTNGNGYPYVNYSFGRAPGFFDEVCWTGDGTSNRAIPHNLTVVPELSITKSRNATGIGDTDSKNWIVRCSAAPSNYLGMLNTSDAGFPWGQNTYWPNTSVWFGTGSSLNTGTLSNGNDWANGLGELFVTYLFATCAGVSKVGSYTGTGTTLQVNCGFTAGARFVLIKRTDSTGDWYVWDTARGIVSGNDPYLLLNSTAAEVTNTDYIDTYSAGFEISSTAPAAINASGGTFIFLAIA